MLNIRGGIHSITILSNFEYFGKGPSIESIDYIFNNAKSWIEIELQKSKMNDVAIYSKSKKLSGTVYNKKLSFNIEIICTDVSFITKFSDFYLNKKPLNFIINHIFLFLFLFLFLFFL